MNNHKFNYPPAKKDDIVDNYHGTAVADPYRWLEDPQSAETQAWVAAQNELTQSFISELPVKDLFEERLTDLWNYAKRDAPQKKGKWLIYQHNDGLQNQPILYKQEGDNEPTVLLDPNKLSEDGTTALINQSYSKDGRFLAYSLSKSGSDWQTIQIRDVATGEDLAETLEWMKFNQPAWTNDNQGFFYARYPSPTEMPDAPPSTHQRIYYHRLGTPQSEDELIYARPDAPNLGFTTDISDDGRYLISHVWDGTDNRNRIHYLDLETKGEFVRLIDVMEAKYNFLGNDGSLFYFETDLEAEFGRIIGIDITQPEKEHWQEIVPETEDAIYLVEMVHNEFIIDRLHHAYHRLYRYSLDGKLIAEIELPTIGSIVELNGGRNDDVMYFLFQSFLYPPTAFAYDFVEEETAVIHQPHINFNLDEYETTQVRYPSKDGTLVPLFITHKKGIKLDGNNPTLLYGYGGFNISIPPLYAPTRIAWLEQGGVYAQASLRGGTEYGEAWHQAGMLHNKQNVFDDFIAAGEWLIENGYCSTKTLAIEGRSNGGLLVAACMVQRPDLFGAVHCAVPVIDMYRFHKFTAGRFWTSEYGNAETNGDDFATMQKYSPLHNVKGDISYPSLIITTADTDDRVVPMHAKKFAATLQAKDSGQHPLLLRIEMKAGHGFGKPTAKLIEEATDVYSFLWTMLTVQADS